MNEPFGLRLQHSAELFLFWSKAWSSGAVRRLFWYVRGREARFIRKLPEILPKVISELAELDDRLNDEPYGGDESEGDEAVGG